MNASRPAIWSVLQREMRAGTSYRIQALYQMVERAIALDEEDRASDGVSQSRWERNVRNLLQYRMGLGDIIRTDRGEYERVERDERGVSSGSRPSDRPWAVRSAAFLHSRLLEALVPAVVALPDGDDISKKPLVLQLAFPLPPSAAFYVYLATDHPSERSLGDYRVQIILPGQRPGTRGRFDRGNAVMPFLVGYVPEFGVFAIWDADVHDAGAGIPYSKGVQVHAATIFRAVALGIDRQVRRTRVGGRIVDETVVAARSDRLREAIEERRVRSLATLLGTR